MKQQHEQPLNVKIYWKNSTTECRYPILKSTRRNQQVYCFEPATPSVIRPPPINDYYRASLISCLTCFWMVTGIVCLVQSLKVRRLLKQQNDIADEKARLISNRLQTNLILTYIFGGTIYCVLIVMIVVIFLFGIKGYFGRSL